MFSFHLSPVLSHLPAYLKSTSDYYRWKEIFVSCSPH